MATSTRKSRICSKGHRYYKTSDCPVCPVCATENKPGTGFLSRLSAPARRALEHQGIITVHQLSGFSEAELLQLHGMGPASLPALRQALKEAGLQFRKKQHVAKRNNI